MKGFGWRSDRQTSPAYCRRDNRVYRSCPLAGNWETCALRCDCLLAGVPGEARTYSAAGIPDGQRRAGERSLSASRRGEDGGSA
jgi:hypothetical protein